MLPLVTGLPRRTQLVLATFFIAGTAWFFTVDSGYGYRGPRVDGDGVYYWVYLRSIVVDHDVDFRNDYESWGNPWEYGKAPRGLPLNPTTLGTAVLWLPFYLPAHLAVGLANRAGAALPGDGSSRIEDLSIFYGSFLYGFLAILLALRLGRRYFPESPALVGVVVASAGGLLIFYMVVQPSYSHAPAAFVVAMFIERWDATRARRSLAGWILLGALGGLAALVRPQLCVIGLLPLSDLLRWPLQRFWARGEGPAAEGAARQLLLLALGALLGLVTALLVFTPQMICWRLIHGSALTIPQGPGFMQWSSSLWSEALFHPRAGLFPWMPVAVPAVVGLIMIARRDPGLGLPLLLLLMVTAYVNGAAWDWWAGYSYGARRFTSLTPIFALGLAAFAHAAWRWVSAHARAFSAAVLLAGLGGICLLNLAMIKNRRYDRVDWHNLPDFYQVYLEAIATTAGAVNKAVGNPFSWPANLAFGARHRVSPSRYDLVAGRYFFDDGHPVVHPLSTRTRQEDIGLTAPSNGPLLVSGFGDVRTVEGRDLIAVTGAEACLLIPLQSRPDLRLTLTGRAARGPCRVSARWNGVRLGTKVLPRELGSVTFEADAAWLRRGVNKLCLSFERVPSPAVPPDLSIGRTGVRAPVSLAAVSACGSAGDHATFWVDGRLVGTNRRGMNVVAVSPRGEVIATRHFDLCRWPDGSRTFLRFIDPLPPGTIVLAAVRTDGSRLFTMAAAAALQRIGAKSNLLGRDRHSYAAIGVRGAPVGTAVEALDARRRVGVLVGDPPEAWVPVAELDRLVLEVTRFMPFE